MKKTRFLTRLTGARIAFAAVTMLAALQFQPARGDDPAPTSPAPGTPQPNPDPGCGNPSTPTNPPPCPPAGVNPINVMTGNVSRSITDLTVWGSVGDLPLAFTRHGMSRYNSGSRWFGDGHIWRHSYQWELTGGGTNVLVLYYPDGTVQRYTYSSSKWNGIASNPDLLMQNGSYYTLQRDDGSCCHFRQFTDANNAAYYQLLDITDHSGNITTLTYDGSQRLARVTEPAGRWLQISYADMQINQEAFTTIAKVNGVPANQAWTEITVTDTNAYRYLRYYTGADDTTNAWGNIAEMEFYDMNGVKLTGSAFGASPSWNNNPATTYAAASDGNVNTYYDYAYPHFGFTGIDLGAGNAKRISKVRFYPRTGCQARMRDCMFQGSNVAPATESVISSVQSSDGRAVNYVYATAPDTVLSQDWVLLYKAQYGDGTHAVYSYVLKWPGQRLLLAEANDPRYHGAAVHMKYDWFTNSWVYGAIYSEINGATGEVVASLKGATGNWDSMTNIVVYPNGKTDTRTFSLGGGATNIVDGLNRTTQNSYSASNQGFLVSTTDPLNRTTTFTRTAQGNVLSATHPGNATESWTRDSLDLVLTHTDELGRTTSFTRDAQHRVTRIDYPDQSYETFTYNGFGQVLSHRLRNGGTENNAYDARGLRTSHTDPLGNATTCTYDAHDLPETETDPHGNATGYEYNERGLVTKATFADGNFVTHTYDDNGNMLTTTNELGKTWRKVYDEFRRVVQESGPLTTTPTTYSYDLPGGVCGCSHAQGKPTVITLPSGKVTKIAYDVEWQKTSETSGFGTADAATTTYGYDLAGNLTMMTDPRGKHWSYTYNQRNWRESATDPLGNKMQWTYDAVGNRLTGQRPAPDNGVTVNHYDAMNRLIDTTDPKSQTTWFTYGGTNNTTKGDNLVALTDASNHTYSFEYDLSNRKTKMTYPDTSYEQWSFIDNAPPGQVASTYRTRAGQVASYTLDNRNREVLCDWSDSTPDITKSYDAASRLLTLNNGVSAISYAYDDDNRLQSETSSISGDGAAKAVSYTYDADGNRASVTYPGGGVVTYGYTQRNQLASVTAGSPPPMATYTYDVNGNRLAKNWENGTSASYTYDDANRLLTLDNRKGSTSFDKLDYAYNTVNNRTSHTETSGTASIVTDSYNYDAIDQVTGVAYGSGRTVSYNYDPVGNRQSVTDNGVTTPYTANNLNQYTAIDSLPTPAYDVNGNLTGYNGWTYTYDAQNRLIGVTGGTNSVTAVFAYDARNRCVSRTINGTTTYYTYDGWNLIQERSSSDAELRRYIHGAQMDEIIAMIDGNGTHFYHHDALGSTVRITGSNGDTEESYSYDVYGAVTIKDAHSNVLPGGSAVGNRFLFTGREWLPSVNLYDYRNRVYSQDFGRFLQSDAMRFDAGDINIYRYAANRPTTVKDPFGLKCVYICTRVATLMPMFMCVVSPAESDCGNKECTPIWFTEAPTMTLWFKTSMPCPNHGCKDGDMDDYESNMT